MLNLSFSTSLTAPVATGKPGVAPAGGVFALSLAVPIAPGVAGKGAATDAVAPRQPLAADGNPLPTPLAATPDVEPTDAALAWLIAPQPAAASAGFSPSGAIAVPTEAGIDASLTLPAAAVIPLATPPQADPAPVARPKRKLDDAAATDQAVALLRPASDLVLPQVVAQPAPVATPSVPTSAARPEREPDDAAAPDQAAVLLWPAGHLVQSQLVAQPAIAVSAPAPDQPPRGAPTSATVAPSMFVAAAPLPTSEIARPAPDSAPSVGDASSRPTSAARPQALLSPTDPRAQGRDQLAGIASPTVAAPARPTSASPAPVGQTPPPAATLIAGRPNVPAFVGDPRIVPSPIPAADAAPTLVDVREIAVRDRGAVTDGNAASTPAVTAAVPPPSALSTAPVVQAASMLFGIALSSALRPGERDNAGGASPRDAALQALTAATGSAQVVGAVVAPDSAQQSSLDMRRHDWPQTMIDHIEALRDAADAVSTRITLMPDALGRVDISLRHDGDTVHVHFAAEAAQTRAMLAEAQPRLTEAAQSRGIRIGQATVDAGQGGGEQQPRHPFTTPAVPQAPRPTSTLSTDPDGDPDSSRLA